MRRYDGGGALMLVAVSPYHLTSREPPALAALLLAERVVTLIPSPRAGVGRASLQRAVEKSPHYLRFMRSWEWSLALWRAGVVSSTDGDADPAEDLYAMLDRIESDPGLSELRPLMRSAPLESEDRFLDELSRDVLRAGPDPAFTVPLTAGLDHFASRRRAIVARPEPISLAQRAEARLACPLFAVALPVLLEAGGELILRARAVLAEPLESLRRAVTIACGVPPTGGPPSAPPAGRSSTALDAPIRSAAARFADAFESARAELHSPRDEARALVGTVALEFASIASDASLDASRAALRAMHGGTARAEEAISPPAEPGRGRVVTVFVRALGSAPRRGV